jgi:hypothetical protein
MTDIFRALIILFHFLLVIYIIISFSLELLVGDIFWSFCISDSPQAVVYNQEFDLSLMNLTIHIPKII